MTVDRQATRDRQARSKPGESETFDQGKEKKTEFLTARQLAQVLQVSESTIHRLRRAGRIPAVMLTDRLIRFNLRDVKHALRPILASRASDGENERDQDSSPQLSFEDLYTDFNG